MAESLLNEEVIGQVRQAFEQLQQPVEVIYFGQEDGAGGEHSCDYCSDTLQLLQEVTAISDHLHLSVYDLEQHADQAHQYRVDKAPSVVIAARDGDQITDYGVRYAGIPAGHEFSTLIHAMILVSGRDSGLDAETRAWLGKLDKPVHLQVFVTPTCPYCPRAVVLAHQMAIESSWVEAEGVEATEFPDLANQFNVSGVPQTTINQGAGTVVGAVPEEDLLSEIQQALQAA